MVRREDWIAQNHMGSIVLIKPGILRAIIIRAGHLGLGLMLRVVATNGYLGSMRTVHFAHWAFLNNGSRLAFFSNFDFSWDSYLDDFIEKANEGLTRRLGLRRRLSADPLPDLRRGEPRPAVQGLGAGVAGRQPLLVQRLSRPHRRPDRAQSSHRQRPALPEPQREGRGSMDERPVSAPDASRPSWKLAPPAAAATQGLVVTGFGGLETGRALFLEIGGKEAKGGWLRTLDGVAPVTAAVPPSRDEPAPSARAAALAFTWTGLARMGLDESALASFSRPFREGMFQEDRLRRLGDRRAGAWLETVVEDGPKWSGNTPLQPKNETRTSVTVHALLLLYASDEKDADAWARDVEAALKPHDVEVVHRLPLVLDVEGAGISREHFGFADGLSQPEPYDESGAVTIGGARAEKDPLQGIPLGEVVIGYANGHGEKAPGPVVPDDPDNPPAAAGLPPHPQAEGCLDFGLNGSYMVVRELKQYVAEFWNSMDANTARIREQDPDHSSHVNAEWLAERVVGRDREGHLLCPGGGKFPADDAGLPRNDFRFFDKDPHGTGCPPGSHVRRAFPRDALAPNEGSRESLLEAANNHRILRRGRKFGPKIADYRTPDGEDRGLLFICLNTDIARQFEFVQQTWLLNSNFATLFDEMDPLVGPEGRMTIREEPLRRTVNVETFVQFAGGEYFFLPSLPALAWLAGR